MWPRAMRTATLRKRGTNQVGACSDIPEPQAFIVKYNLHNVLRAHI